MTTKCITCARDIPEGRNSCPACGTAFGDSVTPTQLLPDDSSSQHKEESGAHRRHSTSRSQRSSLSYDSIDNARFTPGTTVAGRYRIVSLLGRGGMGEVYRADDLKLGQPVALKFLPEALQTDGATLARFHREVRVARQVSHRNVCRVYDIGEISGQHFLSMEFIKGEELASLLRRIGRLPADKAVEIARQLCAGLAAAHDNGVLHRDLKPANVMIDADGNVRITDFGLAGLAEEFRDEELRAGTPAYMAPEQLAGEEVTIKSDIYSLGLVLYEVFTGKRAFAAETLEELLRLRRSETTPTNPSSLVKEIDPIVERVILRCLERDARNRPSSALQVAAALPGGDPLQAALAAGETPSPAMVAAAPAAGVLRPSVALGLLVSFIGLLALLCFFSKYTALYRMVPLEKSPEVLQERAREITKQLGYTEQALDSAYGMRANYDYLESVIKQDSSRTRWDKLRSGQPAAIYFWYRQSPRYLLSYGEPKPSLSAPTNDVTGMTSLTLDTRGRLLSFIGVPPQRDEPQAATETPAPDWSALFAAAGLNQANFQPGESIWVPQHAYDTRAAWDGVYPDQPQIKMHVEAASYRGRPVYFEIIDSWDEPLRQLTPPGNLNVTILASSLLTLFVIVLIGGLLLARRNLRLGLGDRKGAFRVGSVLFSALLLGWILDGHHVPSFDEIPSFISQVQWILFMSGFIWLLYIALEPFVRRRWPDRIISWNRLLAGEFRDPLVGRDILIGALVGALMILNNYLSDLLPKWLGQPPNVPYMNDGTQLLGARYFLTGLSGLFFSSLLVSFSVLFVMLLLSVILRKNWLGALVTWLLISVLMSLALGNGAPVSMLLAPTGAALIIGALYRYGLLTLLAAEFFFHTWVFFPITTEFSAWYAGDFVLALVLLLALASYGFYTSLGDQKIFRGQFLQD
jgi:serine/threonine-protein kinase